MKKIIKQAVMLMIALFIMTSTLASIQHNILAKENPVQRKTIINKKSTKCNFPDDIIEPGPELPKYLYAPKIKRIVNTTNGIKIQWTKVQEADGYNIQTSTSKEFRKLFIKNIKVKRKSSTNISGIDKKKSCYVRIRAYKIEGKNIYYSAWSSMRAIK